MQWMVLMMNSVRHYKRIFPIVCKHCHSYFTSAAAVSRHRKGGLSWFGIPVPEPTVFINEEDDDSDAEIGEKNVDDNVMPVITIGDFLNKPFHRN